jgi:hypothetical protein
VPQGTPGVAKASPEEVHRFNKQVETRETAASKAEEKYPNIPETEMIINRMRALNKQKMYTGSIALPMTVENLISTFTGGKTERGRNTELFGMDSGDLQAAIIKDYGSGNSISDADLVATANRVITAGMDPKSREAALDRLQEKLNAYKFMTPLLRQLREQSVPEKEAAAYAWEKYKEHKAQQDAAKAAAKAESDAKAEAAKAASPNSVPKGPVGPEGQTHSMKNPNSALSQTMDAIGDTVKNHARGAQNLFGFGDREAAVADVERQKARAESEPIYGGAKNIVDTAKYAPALALGPWGAGGVGAAISATEPKESATEQIMSGGGDAAVSAATMGTLNSARLAVVKKQMGKLFDIMDSNPTTSKAFHDAATKLTKLESEYALTSGRTFSGPVKSTWNALPNTVQQALKGAAGITGTGGAAAAAYKYLFGGK